MKHTVSTAPTAHCTLHTAQCTLHTAPTSANDPEYEHEGEVSENILQDQVLEKMHSKAGVF